MSSVPSTGRRGLLIDEILNDSVLSALAVIASLVAVMLIAHGVAKLFSFIFRSTILWIRQPCHTAANNAMGDQSLSNASMVLEVSSDVSI